MQSKILLTSLVLMSAVVLAACTHTEETPEVIPVETDTVEMEASEPMETSPTPGETEVIEDPVDEIEENEEMGAVDYELDLSNYQFTPSVINAEAGETVRVRLAVSQGMHDFVIDELDVRTEVMQVGEETVVEFTVPESAAGQEYEFYCSVGNHRAMGMVGTLVVSE